VGWEREGTAGSGCQLELAVDLILAGFELCRRRRRPYSGEEVDAACGAMALLAGEEGVAARADFDIQLVALMVETSCEIVAAGHSAPSHGVIVGMNTGFHGPHSVAFSGLHGNLDSRGQLPRRRRDGNLNHTRSVKFLQTGDRQRGVWDWGLSGWRRDGSLRWIGRELSWRCGRPDGITRKVFLVVCFVLLMMAGVE